MTTGPFAPDALPEMPCLVCAAHGVFTSISAVGVFYPTTDEARTAVLLLRQRPLQPDTQPGLGYGLCAQHLELPVEQVENVILAMAKQVGVQ